MPHAVLATQEADEKVLKLLLFICAHNRRPEFLRHAWRKLDPRRALFGSASRVLARPDQDLARWREIFIETADVSVDRAETEAASADLLRADSLVAENEATVLNGELLFLWGPRVERAGVALSGPRRLGLPHP